MNKGMALLLLLAASRLGAQAVWFRSDAAGLPLGRVSSPVGLEYALQIEEKGDGEVRTLYQDGKPVTSWRRFVDGEIMVVERYEGDLLVSRERFDGAMVVWEERYADGTLVSRTDYSYRNDRLESYETTDPAGNLVERRRYLYGLDGRLLRVSREGADNLQVEDRVSDGSLSSSWTGSGTSGWYRDFQDGALEREQTLDAGKVVESLVSRATPDGRVTTHDGPQGSIEYHYNLDGKLVEIRGPGDRRERYAYDGGFLLRTVVVESGERQEWEYRRNSKGEILTTFYRKNLMLVKRTDYPDTSYAGDYVETYYNDGTAFLRIRFQDYQEVSRESLPEGQP